jgi:hypothetical protein
MASPLAHDKVYLIYPYLRKFVISDKRSVYITRYYHYFRTFVITYRRPMNFTRYSSKTPKYILVAEI